MENSAIFHAYLISWCIYVVALYVFGRWRRLPLGTLSASHIAPTAAAILMARVFLVGRGATVAQFAVGSKSGADMWSLWFHLWPCLLLLTATSALAHLVWVFIGCAKESQRKWIPVSAASLLMSVFAFMAVGANFPDA